MLDTQLHHYTVQTSQFDHIQQQLCTITSSLQNTKSIPPNIIPPEPIQYVLTNKADQVGLLWQSMTSYWCLIGMLYVYQSNKGMSPNTEPGRGHDTLRHSPWKLTFYSWAWFWDYSFALVGLHCFGNWHYSFRSFNQRPRDSDIFTACRNDDLDLVRDLLKDRKASPFDVDCHGSTALHVSPFQTEFFSRDTNASEVCCGVGGFKSMPTPDRRGR